MYTLFQTLWCVAISATLNRFTAYAGLRDAPNGVRVFLVRDQCPRQHTLLNGIPDQTDGIYTLFQTKMAKSIPYFRLEMLDPLGRHIPIWLIYGSTPPHPPCNSIRPRQCLRARPSSLLQTLLTTLCPELLNSQSGLRHWGSFGVRGCIAVVHSEKRKIRTMKLSTTVVVLLLLVSLKNTNVLAVQLRIPRISGKLIT